LQQAAVKGLAGKPPKDWNMLVMDMKYSDCENLKFFFFSWVDRACINQTDDGMIRHVTTSFSDYIARSRSVVVILSPVYLRRLWCIFEFR